MSVDVPQWKRDLIARLRHQNKRVAAIANGQQGQYSVSVQLPKRNVDVANTEKPVGRGGPRETVVTNGHDYRNMVQQERPQIVEMVTNGYHAEKEEEEEEDLHYGPGIVNKLKNKYLSLALRETGTRPSILQMRKATSLENLLDEDTRQGSNKLFLSKLNGSDNRHQPNNNRYRPSRGHEMKRARSVEAISTAPNSHDGEDVDDARHRNRQSLHEDVLFAAPEINQKVNRPKKLRPLLSPTEKPPTDLVRQAKMIFEKRPEQRTRPPRQTGEVAAKVHTFNTQIVKAKVEKKVQQHHAKGATVSKPPPLPPPPPAITANGVGSKPLDLPKQPPKMDAKELPSPIPDVSRVEDKEGVVLSETPDLILTSSPVQGHKEVENAPRKTPTSQPLRIDVELPVAKVKQEKRQQGVVKKVATTTTAATKRGKATETTSNTAVYDFTGRKDVPDYIANDVSRSPSRPELPKPGEGGIIILEGATILESFTDEDEEILKSLEGPPSPCDVTFINDNVLIDGKSSLSQKTTKPAKLRISFMDGPEVYEYPSETSLMTDEVPEQSLVSQVGHTVPNLGGSSLANYTPKGSLEEFQPGVTRTQQPSTTTTSSSDTVDADDHNHRAIEEIARPFSEGHNADMLF